MWSLKELFRFQQINHNFSKCCNEHKKIRGEPKPEKKSDSVLRFFHSSLHCSRLLTTSQNFPNLHLELLTPLLCAKRWRYLPGSALMVAVGSLPFLHSRCLSLTETVQIDFHEAKRSKKSICWDFGQLQSSRDISRRFKTFQDPQIMRSPNSQWHWPWRRGWHLEAGRSLMVPAWISWFVLLP